MPVTENPHPPGEGPGRRGTPDGSNRPAAGLRAVVVEGSPALRARLVGELSAAPGIDVIAQGSDGQSAIDLCFDLRPDLLVLGIALPGLSGRDATLHLMEHCPTPILLVSAAEDRTELEDTLAALAAGAVDVLEKPLASDPLWARALVAQARMVARIQVITHFGSSLSARRPAPQEGHCLVALGASTGGPVAVAAVLGGLPATFTLPILLVLHLGESFAPMFAAWLGATSGRPVRLATHGEPLESATGQVVMAPPGQHLTLQGGSLALSRGPERHSCRPSVDVLFESLAAQSGPRVAACLLTGMGRDGAAGLLAVHQAGGLTIAQDEATSIVFGMPGEAVRLGAAQHVLPLGEIGPALARLTYHPAEAR